MLKILHERTHADNDPNSIGLKRFQIRKPGRYVQLAVSASADAGNWRTAGRLDVVAAVDASKLEVIAQSVTIPLNQEPLLVKFPGGQDVRYFAFDPWRSRRAGFAKLRLKIWGEAVERRVLAEVPLFANESSVAVPIQGRFTLDRLRFVVEDAFTDGFVGVYTTTGQPIYESSTPAAWVTGGVSVVSTVGRDFDSPTFFLTSQSSGSSGRLRVVFEGY